MVLMIMTLMTVLCLQAGHECWCDNRDDFHRFGKYEHCNVQCVGDKSTFCGGGYAISIYSTSKYSRIQTIYLLVNIYLKDVISALSSGARK